jgi:hypothetical protein
VSFMLRFPKTEWRSISRVGILRLRNEDRFAFLIAPLRMTSRQDWGNRYASQ